MLENWISLDAAIAIANIAIFGLLFFMKQAYNDLREQVKEHRDELTRIKETYIRRDDFGVFKLELWSRLDQMEKYWSQRFTNMEEYTKK